MVAQEVDKVMNEEREKSFSEKKLEKVLGISDQFKQFDDGEKNEVVAGDEEKKRKFEERKEYLKEIRASHEKLKIKDDKQFSKDIYRELIEIDMEVLRITRKEMEMSPNARYVETIGTLTGAITNTLDSLRDIEETEVAQGFEREKLDIKKNAASGGTINNSVVLMGGFTEVMEKIAQMNKDKALINIEQVKEEDK
jgi:hypothetical protein